MLEAYKAFLERRTEVTPENDAAPYPYDWSLHIEQRYPNGIASLSVWPTIAIAYKAYETLEPFVD